MATIARPVTSFRVDPALWEEFRGFCAAAECSQTEALEDAIRQYMDPAEGPSSPFERRMTTGLLCFLRNPRSPFRDHFVPLFESLFTKAKRA